MAYVDTTELTEYLRNTIVADEVEIEAARVSAESTINAMCQRTFAVPTTATTRTFVPTQGCAIVVPDIANTTDLVIVDDGSTVSSVDYQLEVSPGVPGPVGLDGRTWPYTRIVRLSSWWHVPYDGEATLSITARWGWPAVPDEVKLATKLLARDYQLARDTGFGIVQVGEFSRRVAANGVVVDLLSHLRRAESWGIA